jgi:hypothetical protein
VELAINACRFVCKDAWELRNAQEMILAQTECYFILAQCIQKQLVSQSTFIWIDYIFAYQDMVRLDEDGEEYKDSELTPE